MYSKRTSFFTEEHYIYYSSQNSDSLERRIVQYKIGGTFSRDNGTIPFSSPDIGGEIVNSYEISPERYINSSEIHVHLAFYGDILGFITAIGLAVGAVTIRSAKTTPLLSGEEWVAAMAKASSVIYTPAT